MASNWQPIETAPRGSGADGPQDTRHPNYVEPPRILAWSPKLGLMVVYWDWYYAEGGNGYEAGRTAWVNEDGALWPDDAPTHWMPLPDPPSVVEVIARRSCCVPAPDRSGRQCDKPEGHAGDHWTYGGHTLTWPNAVEVIAPQDYYAKALGLVADELERLEPADLNARRWKLIAVIRNAADPKNYPEVIAPHEQKEDE